jgi:hypothetical protein
VLRDEEELAEMLAALHHSVGLGGLGQRESRVDHRAEPTLDH